VTVGRNGASRHYAWGIALATAENLHLHPYLDLYLPARPFCRGPAEWENSIRVLAGL
jgi:hypothetical protein